MKGSQKQDLKSSDVDDIENFLLGLIAAKIGVKPDEIKTKASFFSIGISSLVSEEIFITLNSNFSGLSSTLLFEQPNINRLAKYLSTCRLKSASDLSLKSENSPGVMAKLEKSQGRDVMPKVKNQKPEQNSIKDPSQTIAIIGISGRFPQADNPDALWENLFNNTDSVVEIPENRWEFMQRFSSDKRDRGAIFSKWGGFINDVDKFDPLFFQISHREAESLDPQQKLFLQCSWELMEDAGYGNPEQRATDNVGVYVGVTWNEFSILAFEEGLRQQEYRGAGSLYWGIPNRTSYFLNFNGPSIAIDTACSSSLIAIHDACQALRSGECDMAIAGGVNLNLHPAKYVYLSQNHFLSSDGRCRSFGEGGDGYVPGEGVAAVLLKPLDQAEADGDYIYGLVRGSAVNHGGKVTGYTVPNPNAHKALVSTALKQAQVDPQDISYIECHGTGTELGDPIEITGLTSAFKQHTDKKQFCAIGSLKSNIGHLEAAAGVAGLIKILQSMRHKSLPASLHSEVENQKLALASSPFYIAKKNQGWLPDNDNNALIAGISSFGAGGSNAHLIVENYDNAAVVERKKTKKKHIIVFSSQTQPQLQEYVEKFTQFIARIDNDERLKKDYTIADIAFTLLQGREHFSCRLALVVNSFTDLCLKLQAYQKNPDGVKQLYRGSALGESATKEQSIGSALKWAEKWVTAEVIAKPSPGRRVPLPTYVFLKERSWISDQTPLAGAALNSAEGNNANLHPLVDCNSSTLQQQKYQKTFHIAEFVLNDHLVNKVHVIPGVCHLEIARATAELAAELPVLAIRDVWFSNVISVENSRRVEIGFTPKGSDIHYEITDPEQGVIFSRGKIIYSNSEEKTLAPSPIDLAGIRSALQVSWGKDSIYPMFVRTGIIQKTSFQVVDHISFNSSECLAKLLLPNNLHAEFSRFGLHPALMDGAVQTAMMYTQYLSDTEVDILPFHFSEVKTLKPLCHEVYVHCRLVDFDRKQYDMSITDSCGETLVEITSFILKEMKAGSADTHALSRSAATAVEFNSSQKQAASIFASYYSPIWTARALSPSQQKIDRILLLGPDSETARGVFKHAEFSRCDIVRLVPADAYNDDDINNITIRWDKLEDYQRALKALKSAAAIPTHIIFLNNDLVAIPASSVFLLSKSLIPLAKSAKILCPSFSLHNNTNPLVQALSGFLKTLKIEKPAFDGKVVHFDCDWRLEFGARISHNLSAELSSDWGETDVIYRDGERKIREFSASQGSCFSSSTERFCRGGCYLITGGLGAIGLIFAKFLCETYGADVYLTGRSDLNDKKQQRLDDAKPQRGNMLYLACDVSVYSDVENLLQAIADSGHQLKGVIHSAGVIDDGFVLKKSSESFNRVIQPKVKGTLNLDLATKNIALDFFVTFSSVTSILGNFGQCDYAYGNAFEDYYAFYREGLVEQGQRSGKSLSINWPYWKDGGMRLNDKEEALLTKTFGFVPLTSADGVRALVDGLHSELSEMAVLPAGDVDKIHQILGISSSVKLETGKVFSSSAPSGIEADKDLNQMIEGYLKQTFAKELKIPIERIDASSPLSAYGMDSIVMIDLITIMDEKFQGLPKTLFFEHDTLNELTAYFAENYAEYFSAEAPSDQDAAAKASVNTPKETQAASKISPAFSTRLQDNVVGQQVHADCSAYKGDIAIVGLAGQYPEAKDPQQLWENLKQGRDSVTEVPQERWNLDELYQPGEPTQGKSYAKWGGFLSEVDTFDPLFFNISPKEAELMDPQERLFLETVYRCIEDAGYTSDNLAADQGVKKNPVGVFVGTMWGDYQLFGVENEDPSQWLTPRSFYWAVANRVSHYFNFSGPSLAIDTACSSSLTAIHLACDSIRLGQCQVAIAGGVNLSLHPNKYNLLSDMQFLSSDGRCRSFGEGGDGYVPGEGVGAVLLKPVDQAIAAKDNIYAVIKGSAVNHGGKTSGFTVPNPKLQSQLIADAFQIAGVNPRHVSYLEAHGTGTSLGDPIEILGLNKAFAQQATQYCSIGSLKSNIGHLEAAAGIAALTKVLLQIKHKTLVPSLHSEKINTSIDFSSSPFYVQQELQDWERPIFREGDVEVTVPRIAGISSFGAGGSNAHLIVEEYIPTEEASLAEHSASSDITAILLSARSDSALKNNARQLSTFIANTAANNLGDMAYTLQVGRAAMDHRLVVLCSSVSELQEKLTGYLQGKTDIEGLILGQALVNNPLKALLFQDGEGQSIIHQWIEKRNFSNLATLWAGGSSIDWESLYQGAVKTRISLPTYVFEKESYWIQKPAPKQKLATLQPLLDANISTLQQILFSKTLNEQQFFIRDHKFGDVSVMPGVAHLEMALQAGKIASDKKIIGLSQVLWLKPLVVKNADKRIHLALIPSADDLYFETFDPSNPPSDQANNQYCQGRLKLLSEDDKSLESQTENISLDTIKSRCTKIEVDEFSREFSRLGFNFGPTFNLFEEVYSNANEALSFITLPQSLSADADRYTLHPAILDAALRTVMSIGGLNNELELAPVPVALENLSIFKAVNTSCCVYALEDKKPEAKSRVSHYSIFVCNAEGEVLVKLENLMTQGLKLSRGSSKKLEHPENVVSEISVLIATAEAHIKTLLSTVVKLSIDKIDSKTPLSSYGVDSMMIISMNKSLEEIFGPLSKTLFFEYQDVLSLAEYFASDYPEQLSSMAEAALAVKQSGKEVDREAGKDTSKETNNNLEEQDGDEEYLHREDLSREFGFSLKTFTKAAAKLDSPPQQQDIAIVGVSGRYPQADNLDEFLKNLRAGKDCVSEVPLSRWDPETYFTSERKKMGKTYSKWGGFLNGIGEFDPLFFNITPNDAVTIDPQERLFLETVWEAIENAGHTKASLSQSKVGVFVGVMWGHYELLGLNEGECLSQKSPTANFSSIANRASYWFDFTGPSMALDTMCSSSLTSIHLACESIKRGECDVAVAGGVNLSIHPRKYQQLSGFQFLSTDGRCRSFGEGGDGYVPGEGVGAILLKPLSKAEADGDFIYGLVKGTGVNHGGKSNGFYVPNPNAQASLVSEVLSKNNIDPQQISYMEAHGTGTALGDPIEMTGLKKGLGLGLGEGLGGISKSCSVGSVKSNIGHLEAAAGIAGITKILLQMNHQQLFPSLHSKVVNTNVGIADSPFYIQQDLATWSLENSTQSSARYAGINSFGAGGSNAFIVLSDYPKTSLSASQDCQAQDSNAPYLIPISAKGVSSLRQYTLRLALFIEEKTTGPDNTDNYGVALNLNDLAYTLQNHREAMVERVVLVVNSLEDLRDKLTRYGNGERAIKGIYSSDLGDTAASAEDKLQTMAITWVKGEDVDYSVLDLQRYAIKIPLPTYAFQRKNYWFTKKPAAGQQAVVKHDDISRPVKDSLIDGVDISKSTGLGMVFQKRLKASDSIVSGHRFNNRTLLPGVAYIEMVRQALASSSTLEKVVFKNIVWQKPLFISDTGTDIFISLRSGLNNHYSYEVWTSEGNLDKKNVHAKGSVSLDEKEFVGQESQHIDIAALRKAPIGRVNTEEFYQEFSTFGIAYDEDFRSIDDLSYHPTRSIANYSLPISNSACLYHPAILDGALQSFVMLPSFNSDKKMKFPFSVERIEMLHALPSQGHIVSVSEPVEGNEAYVLNKDGLICVRFLGIQFRSQGKVADLPASNRSAKTNAAAGLSTVAATNNVSAESLSAVSLSAVSLNSKIESYVKNIFSGFLGIDEGDLNATTSFDQYGLESVLALDITARLEKEFSPLPATLLFEYQSIAALAEYFIAEHGDHCKSIFFQQEAGQLNLTKDSAPPTNGSAVLSGGHSIEADQSCDTGSMSVLVEEYIKGIFSDHLGIETQDLRPQLTFEHFGVESVVAIDLKSRLERDFGPLSSTLLFENETIQKLSEYFVAEHAESCDQQFGKLPKAKNRCSKIVSAETDINALSPESLSYFEHEENIREAISDLSDDEVEHLLSQLSE